MTAKELIEKLQKVHPDTPVSWDSHGYDYYFGGNFDVEHYPDGWKEGVDQDEFPSLDKMPETFEAVLLS